MYSVIKYQDEGLARAEIVNLRPCQQTVSDNASEASAEGAEYGVCQGLAWVAMRMVGWIGG